jgi:hypothetical protein
MADADEATNKWTENCISSGLSSSEGIIWRVRDPIYKTAKGKRELED